MASALHIGFFKDFKSSDTLLLESIDGGLEELAAALRSLVDGTSDSVPLHGLPFVEAHGQVRVTAVRSSLDHGIRCLEHTNSFVWKRSCQGWQDVIEKIEALICCTSGHHYMDADDDEVTIEVGKGEYGDDWWAGRK